ncbi:hypothetical protein [uncultured Winogradskyella sp.]|uniref:hypothetical protein n=1 Tax=uncultured Winogradskyella sp. TaxID=395353 RepID=UPI00261DFE45|nr:hypothetical protein [uncultured Winogradskyella sp.]
MLLTIFIVLFVSFVIYLLLMPIIIVIDTISGKYYIQLKGLAKASIVYDEKEILKIKLRAFFLNFNFYPFRVRLSPKQSKKPKKSMDFRIGLKIIKSFKVKQFYLNLDTGNCITNAKLYPFFAFLNYYKGGYNINFTGQNTLQITIENRPIRIIKSFINF